MLQIGDCVNSQKPKKWEVAAIAEIAAKVAMGPFGSSIKVDTFVPEGVPVISGAHLHGVRLDDTPGYRFIRLDHAQRLSNSNVCRGDVVFTHAGNIGQVAYIPRNSDFDRYIISQRQFYMRCDRSKVIPEYVASYFRSPHGQHQLLANTSQVGVPSIAQPVSYLRTVEIPVPPLTEQRAVVRVLETLEDKIDLNRRMSATLESMARALFKSWFVDFDPVRAKMEGRDSGLPQEIDDLFPARLVESEFGAIPEGWELTTLGDLCQPPQYGYTASAKSDPVGPRLLRITDINKAEWITWDDVPYCEISSSDLQKYRVVPGDILIARMADPGHGVLIEDDELAVFASYLIRFRPVDPVLSRFLQYWLRSRGYWEVVAGRFSGTTRMSINAQQLRSLPLVVPGCETVEAFALRINTLRAAVVAKANQTSSLIRVRDTLLPKLISGERRLPASVLARYDDTTRTITT